MIYSPYNFEYIELSPNLSATTCTHSTEQDEMAYYELPHADLHCLPAKQLNMISIAVTKQFFFNFAVCFFCALNV